jgi:hypothetical protein
MIHISSLKFFNVIAFTFLGLYSLQSNVPYSHILNKKGGLLQNVINLHKDIILSEQHHFLSACLSYKQYWSHK